MTENNFEERRTPPEPPPRRRTNDPPNYERIYEEVNVSEHHGSSSDESSASDSYIAPNEGSVNEVHVYDYARDRSYENYGYTDLNQMRRDVQYNHHYRRLTSDDIMKKIGRFKSSANEFLDGFESTHDEIRTEEEHFIIVHLLSKCDSKSPVLGGNLEQLAMLACCSSPHVVKRALDALINEIFLSISNSSRIRCHNLLKAEKILRESFVNFMTVDNMKAKCHRMTTYSWIITLVLLKCSKEECIGILPKIKEFESNTLDALQNDREYSGRNTFRYGIYLARESIKRISGRKDSSESLHRSMKKCENLLNSKLEKDEVMKLGKAVHNGGSWMDLHVCLVFLQDLPKFHQFQNNTNPIILIQMLIADFRERCSFNKVKSWLKFSNYKWQFEILVYHLMLRLLRTSKDKAIIDQVLVGEEGCGGVFRGWIDNRSNTTKDPLVMTNLEKLCQRAVFVAPSYSFEPFVTDNCKGDEKSFIESLSIFHVSSTYKVKVLEIVLRSQLCMRQQQVSTYDAVMNGKKCLLKLHQHTREDVLRTDALKSVPLRKEIEIFRVLNAAAEPCPYIVRLLGSSIDAPMHLIIERTPKDDLLTYLRGFLNVPETKAMFQFALDVCNAMIYLGEQNLIHRDLCAKNCFVFMENGILLTKLGDFHLANLSYPGPKSPTGRQSSITRMVNDFSNEFAVRWMAIEVFQFGEFRTASDVWSFGVLLSEIFTFGCKPYVNMPSGLSLERDEEVREFVINGNRLELHPKIPESIQVLIQLTMVDADHRPTFSALSNNLLEMKFEDEMYPDPAYFGISNDNITDGNYPQINPRTGCIASGCFGDCLNASDIAVPLNVDDNHFIKEFIPASSSDILKLSELEFCSLAVITDKIAHDEKLELITEVGDMNSLEEFISEFGCETENAMMYLSQIVEAVSFLHKRRFIHRNLRAASVFIYSNGNAKLACFARVRRLMPNVDNQSSTMPIHLSMSVDSLRWSSPEVITDGIYSKASDVWSFGILMWEIFTLIEKDLDESDEEISHLPYHELISKGQILSYLHKGKRLGQPKSCPDRFYEIMLECWEHDVQDRLDCQDIAGTL